MRCYFFIVLILSLLSTPSWAEKFSNKFIEFELPQGFICRVEETENVCQSRQPEKSKEAVVVFAAKIQGPDDTLGAYESHLNKSRFIKDSAGRPVEVKISFSKVREINDHSWVDALHLNGEIPEFYTRYLATVKADLGILFTFSVRKDKYKGYAVEFSKMVQSLRVFRKSGPIPGLAPQDSSLLPAIDTGAGSGMAVLPPPSTGDKKDKIEGQTGMDPKQAEMIFYIVTAIVAAGILFLYKKLRSKK